MDVTARGQHSLDTGAPSRHHHRDRGHRVEDHADAVGYAGIEIARNRHDAVRTAKQHGWP